MDWYLAAAIVVLLCIVTIYLVGRHHRPEPSRPHPAEVPEEQVPAEEAKPEPPGRLRAILKADLAGQPGYFAPKWEPEAAYHFYVETAGSAAGTTTHDIATGWLGFWRGGAGRTNHDAGYALSDQDLDAIKGKLIDLLQSLHAEGWDIADTADGVRQTLGSSLFGIRVAAHDMPYDTSPKPGTIEVCVLDAGLYRRDE